MNINHNLEDYSKFMKKLRNKINKESDQIAEEVEESTEE